MKKRAFHILAGVILLASLLACGVTINTDNWGGETIRGSGNVVEENRDMGSLSGVELSMPGTLHIELGSQEALLIEADDNLLEYIQTDVSGGRLVIRSRPGTNLQPTSPINYYLTVTELDTIEISSSGDVEAGDLQADHFSATISSSGDLSIGRLDCTSLRIEISSSGEATISDLTSETITVRISSSGNLNISGGEVQEQVIDISSSGEYTARDLASVEADVTLTSSGSATIRVSDHLRGRLSSSGSVYYIGSPQVDVSTNSSGKTRQINE